MNYGRSFRLMVECAKRAFCSSPSVTIATNSPVFTGASRASFVQTRETEPPGFEYSWENCAALMDFSKFRNESCICIEIGHGNDRVRFESCCHFEFEMNAYPKRSELDRVVSLDSRYFKFSTLGWD